MSINNEKAEAVALRAGWRPDPRDFDQWKHPHFPDEVFWGALDIPEKYLDPQGAAEAQEQHRREERP